MYQGLSQEAWVIALRRWNGKIAETIHTIEVNGDSIGFFGVRELIAKIDWHMCHFCPGDCFGCPEKDSEDFYVCDECEFSQCAICPYKTFLQSFDQSFD